MEKTNTDPLALKLVKECLSIIDKNLEALEEKDILLLVCTFVTAAAGLMEKPKEFLMLVSTALVHNMPRTSEILDAITSSDAPEE